MSENSNHLLYSVEIFHNRATHQFLIVVQDVPKGGRKSDLLHEERLSVCLPCKFLTHLGGGGKGGEEAPEN